MPTALHARITEDRDQLIELIQSLIRFQTVNPPGNAYPEICDFLARRLRTLGFRTSVHHVSEKEMMDRRPDLAGFPRANVVGRWDVGAEKTVHLNAHFDVVPASAGWTHGPFEPVVEGDWLYGRGSADMKGAIGSLFLALGAFHSLKRKPAFNVEVSLTADEETDSVFGASWIVEQGLVKADWAVVCEGGSGLSIGCGHNGVVWLEVTVIGRAAHGAHPDRGVNAVEKMSRLVTALEGYKKRLEKITFLAPDGRPRIATINVGGVTATAAGGKINTVPGSVTFTIDRRVLPNENLVAAERDLRAFIGAVSKEIPDLKTEVTSICSHPSSFVDPKDPLPAQFARSVTAIRRRRPEFSVSAGFNDSHFFAQGAGLPTIGYGPGGFNYHAADERISIRELLMTARIYAHFLEG